MPGALKPFEYVEATDVEQAAGILSKWGVRAKVLAGGVGLVDDMRRRVVTPECVVSIRNIAGLGHITGDGKGGLRIGSMATMRAIEQYESVRTDYLPLYEAVHHVPSPQVKNMATLVGNLCIASPASDVAPPLIAFGAELKIAGPGRTRSIPVESFFLGVNRTALGPGELVSEISVPAVGPGTGGAFLRLARIVTDVAKLNVAVVLRMSGDTCQDARIALGAVAPTPIRARKSEEILKGQKLDHDRIAAAAKAASGEATPITDIRSTAEYRREMVALLVEKALNAAL
ncbi:MAG: xanthine dehydrogenase family protein subunit M, partial [Dehalococcoidia bacterium]|nr:xanthine dehydrogenase family protein subunit M [Dehalococcoidia bacterium]